jgi:hypothetical protein
MTLCIMPEGFSGVFALLPRASPQSRGSGTISLSSAKSAGTSFHDCYPVALMWSLLNLSFMQIVA